MTITVKLDPALELELRQRAVALGQSTSDVIREALRQHLMQPLAAPTSAHALGAGLFGRFSGSVDLASQRKRELAEIWGATKHRRTR